MRQHGKQQAPQNVEETGQGHSASTRRQFSAEEKIRIVLESWRRHYNAVRPHASLGYKPPASEVFVPAQAAWPATRATPTPSSTQPLAERGVVN